MTESEADLTTAYLTGFHKRDDLIAALRKELADCAEQCRLLGAGGSREARLMARVNELSRERDDAVALLIERENSTYTDIGLDRRIKSFLAKQPDAGRKEVSDE